MSKKVILKNMKCPTCGGTLRAENSNDDIVCIYCGNTVVPITEKEAAMTGNFGTGSGEKVKIEGIKTASSALAYAELFFEDYDWESFAYMQTLTVDEVDEIAESLKFSSTDEKNTWILCFKAACVPFGKKVEGLKNILNSALAEYKKNNLDAYSKFDTYKSNLEMILADRAKVLECLGKYIEKAAKYGAAEEEVASMKAEMDKATDISGLVYYENFESVPELKSYIEEKNKAIADALSEKGIDAEAEYEQAEKMMEEKNYCRALDSFVKLGDYKESKKFINKINSIYEIGDILEICGNLYRVAKEEMQTKLYPKEGNAFSNTATVTEIKKIVSNYADKLYYIDNDDALRVYNFTTNEKKKYTEKSFEKDCYIDGTNIYLLTSGSSRDIAKINMVNESLELVVSEVEGFSFNGGKIIYGKAEKKETDDYSSKKNIEVYVMNPDTLQNTKIGDTKTYIEAIVGDLVFYTIKSPVKANRDLYVKDLSVNEPGRLIERNIYEFCSVVSDKIFYYIGSEVNKTMININFDGTGRKEWPLYTDEINFVMGGWMYFTRKAGYNSAICKSRIDGSELNIIASDIAKFVGFENGYLYYIDSVNDLMKVRMDGSNLTSLCSDVAEVLSIKEDKIIFVSYDYNPENESDELGELEVKITPKLVKSIYAVDFKGSGKIKLAYDVKNAKKYDDNAIYYIKSEKVSVIETEGTDQGDVLELELNDVLYVLDVTSNKSAKIVDIAQVKAEGKISGFAITLIVAAITALIGLMILASDGGGVGAFFLVVGVITAVCGVMVKMSQEE